MRCGPRRGAEGFVTPAVRREQSEKIGKFQRVDRGQGLIGGLGPIAGIDSVRSLEDDLGS